MSATDDDTAEIEKKIQIKLHPDHDGGSESREPTSLGSSAGSVFCTLERDYARTSNRTDQPILDSDVSFSSETTPFSIEYRNSECEILNDMKSNEALANYETEYMRLFESLYETHRNEEDLMEKCRNLEDQVIEKTNNSYVLEKSIESYEDVITKLKQDIVNASKLADAAHTREQNAQEVIENLRLTITKLNHELEQKNKQLAMDEDTTVSKQKDGWLKEREHMTNELETLRQRLHNKTVYTDEMEKKTSDLEEKIVEMQENLDMQRSEISKERKIRERLENDLQQLEENLKLNDIQLQTANASMKTLSANASKLENSLRQQKTANEKLQKEVNKLMVKRMNLQTELDAANRKIEETEKNLEDRNKEYTAMCHENNRTREDNDKLKSEKDGMAKKCLRIDGTKTKLENELANVRLSLKNAEFEINSLQRQAEDERKATGAVIREKDSLAKIIAGLKEQLRRAHHASSGLEQTKQRVEAELEEATQTASETRNRLHRVEKERDRLNQESQELAQQVEDHMDVIKLKQVEIFDYKKRLAEAEAKFRQQQNLFEAVTAERNTCSKSLIEAQDEIQEIKIKLKIMSHQVEQLKEDVTTKETSLAKEEFLLGKAEKDKDNLRAELHSLRKTMNELRKEMDEGRQEEKRLRQTIQMADMDVSRLKKDIDTVMNERDVLGTQLVRRNDELSLQYSRIKIFNGTIKRGETQYAQRLDDIRLLKLEIQKLRTEKVLLTKNITNMSDLRHEIFHLERELTNERLKVTALEEEVENPLNIHRWRKLGGTDPDTFELLKKIQILQKRVLKMSAELISKENKIKECMELYVSLRREVWKRPEPEVVASLKETQKALRERGDKMKCLAAELNMCESQSNTYKYDLERMNRELQDFKAKYYALKRKDQKLKNDKRRKVQSASEPIMPVIQPGRKKFCGGGFNMGVLTPRNCYSLETTQK